MYKKVILDNGVRVVLERMSSLKSVALGVWATVGSRDEKKGEGGLSHFIEHMMFKGTPKRTASQISNEIDALGGEMNAFTTHEATAFYVKVLDQQMRLAFDLIADLFHHSRFSAKDIAKEKQIVLEEIRTVQDDPEDYIHELHAKDIFGSHPLGRPILGEPGVMKRLSRQALMQYRQRHYRPEHTIVAVAGNFSFPEIIDTVNTYFGKWKHGEYGKGSSSVQKTPWPDQPQERQSLHVKPLEQVHVCVGFKGLPVGHPDRYAAHVLSTILGGGVSSRLFQEIREKRGLAYTIYSHLSGFLDGGTLTVYAATRPNEMAAVVDRICQETRKLCRREVASNELERTKTQLKGSLMLGLEGTYGRMNKLAKDEMYQGRHVTLQEMVKAIDRISPEQIRHLSQKLFDLQQFVVTALGPIPKRGIPRWG
ncbi:M16 family metallopeptidase [Candidatus Nitrospira allomarina]|uniref:Pitrilysin family protein n=1 Tax=Candidatus Nitrospira allomarina TaxID=3020900 RepID=A0AA96GCC3_9BACT|nr:pitrilysin family protein [Candidatus Nitrospira allomarina]WNM58417.1 pitrilysin family protein [Candidatus Nitrospira allomarina]